MKIFEYSIKKCLSYFAESPKKTPGFITGKYLIHLKINSEVRPGNGGLNLNIMAKLQDAVNALNYGIFPNRIKRKKKPALTG